jgi:hypothetical protein
MRIVMAVTLAMIDCACYNKSNACHIDGLKGLAVFSELCGFNSFLRNRSVQLAYEDLIKTGRDIADFRAELIALYCNKVLEKTKWLPALDTINSAIDTIFEIFPDIKTGKMESTGMAKAVDTCLKASLTQNNFPEKNCIESHLVGRSGQPLLPGTETRYHTHKNCIVVAIDETAAEYLKSLVGWALDQIANGNAIISNCSQTEISITANNALPQQGINRYRIDGNAKLQSTDDSVQGFAFIMRKDNSGIVHMYPFG